MVNKVKKTLTKLIRLADEVSKVAEEARYCKEECIHLKSKSEKLAALLRRVPTKCSDLSQYPIYVISNQLFRILHEGLSLVLKCRDNILNRLFTQIPVAEFHVVSSHLEDFIADVSWPLHLEYLGVPRISEISCLLRDRYIRIPLIVANEIDLEYIWEKITILYTGSLKDRYDAAASLVTFACKRRYRKFIVEERWFGPLLNQLNEGRMEDQEIATRAMGLLGRCPESVQYLIQLGVCSLFAKLLKQGPMTVQAAVAWAVSELAGNYPKCQNLLASHDTIKLLVDHLAFVKVEEHNKYAVVSMKPTTTTSSNFTYGTAAWHQGLKVKEMAARALWRLAKGNSPICHTIVESSALLYFAVLLEMGTEDVQYNSAMAVLEITAVAEKDADLRKYAFDSNSPDCKAIVDQLLRIIDEANSAYLIPCVKAIGNLTSTFKTATRIIRPLLRLLSKSHEDTELIREILNTLTRFAYTENDLHVDHCKAIISAGGVKRLIEVVNLADQMVHTSALVLLSYIGLHLPHREELAKAEVLAVLERACKQSTIRRDKLVEELLIESKSRLELYQPREFRIP